MAKAIKTTNSVSEKWKTMTKVVPVMKRQMKNPPPPVPPFGAAVLGLKVLQEILWLLQNEQRQFENP
jgi:hypothetical protein